MPPGPAALERLKRRHHGGSQPWPQREVPGIRIDPVKVLRAASIAVGQDLMYPRQGDSRSAPARPSCRPSSGSPGTQRSSASQPGPTSTASRPSLAGTGGARRNARLVKPLRERERAGELPPGCPARPAWPPTAGPDGRRSRSPTPSRRDERSAGHRGEPPVPLEARLQRTQGDHGPSQPDRAGADRTMTIAPAGQPPVICGIIGMYPSDPS